MHDDSLIPSHVLKRLVRFGVLLPGAVGIVLWLVVGNGLMLGLALVVVGAFGFADLGVNRNPEQATLAIAWISFLLAVTLLPAYGGSPGL